MTRDSPSACRSAAASHGGSPYFRFPRRTRFRSSSGSSTGFCGCRRVTSSRRARPRDCLGRPEEGGVEEVVIMKTLTAAAEVFLQGNIIDCLETFLENR